MELDNESDDQLVKLEQMSATLLKVQKVVGVTILTISSLCTLVVIIMTIVRGN